MNDSKTINIVLPSFIECQQDNSLEIVLPKIQVAARQSLRDCPTEVIAFKTILNCLTEWYSARQFWIVCPIMHSQDNLDCLTEEMPARQFLRRSRQSWIV